jgi:uncharacterized protein (DUF934 family)
MPRLLLRDRRVVEDEWLYVAEAGDKPDAPLIVTLEQWRNEPQAWLERGSRLGVVLAPADRVEALAPDLKHFALVAAEFPGPADGRGYSQARLLRERYGFSGELRATGYVRHDQLFFLARCGFNSFQLAERDLNDAVAAFSTFSAAYQPANDVGLAVKLTRQPLSPQ